MQPYPWDCNLGCFCCCFSFTMQPYQFHPKSKWWTVVVRLTSNQLPPSASLLSVLRAQLLDQWCRKRLICKVCHWMNLLKLLFRVDIITNTCFMSSLWYCVLFSDASFWHHQNAFDITDTTPGHFLFCVQVTKEKHVDWDHFCHRLFASLWNEVLIIMYCSVLAKM